MRWSIRSLLLAVLWFAILLRFGMFIADDIGLHRFNLRVRVEMCAIYWAYAACLTCILSALWKDELHG